MTSIYHEAAVSLTHNNQDSWQDRFPELARFANPEEQNRDTMQLMHDFDALWNTIDAELQQPVQNQDKLYSGYSGHRIVTFEGGIGRCALGFHLISNGLKGYRTIEADRRKIYPLSRPRSRHIADTLNVTINTSLSDEYDQFLRHQLTTLAGWSMKFLEANPYE